MITSERRRWLALAVVCLAQLMITLDTTIVNVALGKIQSDLHFTEANLTWVINAFLVTFGSFLLLAGRLGDLIGRRRVFLAGVGLFTLSSILCGLATDAALLIAFRFVQGIGAALQASVILAIIVAEFPAPAERARAMSAYIFAAVAGGSLGLLAGGLLTQLLDWHWIFFINVPIGLGTILAGRVLIPRDRGIGLAGGVDWLGSALVTFAIGAGVYGIVEAGAHGWDSLQVLIPLGAALALGAGFVALESRIANPIMPLRVFRHGGLLGASVVRGFLMTGMYGIFFLGSLYLARVLGYDPIKTGLAFLPWTLMVMLLSLGVTERLVAALGAMRALLLGIGAMVAGMLVLRVAGAHAGYFPVVLGAMLLMGFGLGTSFMPLLTIAMGRVPAHDAGLASGFVNVSGYVAGALGLALLSTIASDHSRGLVHAHLGLDRALVSGYDLAYLVGALIVVAGALLAVVVLRSPQPAVAAAPSAERGSAPAQELELAA